MTALSLFPTATNATTLATARTLQTAAAGASTGVATTIAKRTGLHEIFSQAGNAGANLAVTGTAIGTIATQVHGWLFDATTLEARRILSGSVQPVLSVLASAITISGKFYVRYWKRSSAGVYTNIATFSEAAGTAFTTAAAVRTLPLGSLTQTDLAAGDKFYVEVICDVTANTANSNTATITLNELGTALNTTFPTAGYVEIFDGSSAGVGVGSGALSLPRGLAGTSAGVGFGSDPLKVARRLTGSARGVGTGVDAFLVARRLTGAAHGDASSSGSVSVSVARPIGGTSHGVSTSSGLVGAARRLAGEADGHGVGSGTVATPPTFAGTSRGSATAAGALPATRTASGTVTGTATPTGSVRIGRALTGSAHAAGAVSGSIRVARGLTGTGRGSAVTLGAVGVHRGISGATAGVGSASGSTGVRRALAGSAAGHGGGSGVLPASRTLTGTSRGIATAIDPWSINATWLLAGTAAGSGSASGELTVATEGAQLVLELWESGAYVADLGTYSVGPDPVVLSARWDATLLADPTGAGVELRIRTIGGSGADVGAVEWNALVYSTAGEQDHLTGTARGIAAPTGSLDVAHPLAGSAAGVAVATGALTGAVPLSGTSAGVAVATGAVRRQVELSGTARGVGVAVGTLRVRGVRGVIVPTIHIGPQILPTAGTTQIATGVAVAAQIPAVVGITGAIRAASAASGSAVATISPPAEVRLVEARAAIIPSARRRQIVPTVTVRAETRGTSGNPQLAADTTVSDEISGGDVP